MDEETAQAVAMRYGVRAVSTVILFRGGEVVDRMVGVEPRSAYVARIDERLRSAAA